jgi:hypothetical protein
MVYQKSEEDAKLIRVTQIEILNDRGKAMKLMKLYDGQNQN